jgi:hypothetical protein
MPCFITSFLKLFFFVFNKEEKRLLRQDSPEGSNFGDFRIDFLGENESICETASARESGP